MKIETKYDKKQVVWTMKDNKAVSGTVDEIHISVVKDVYILYVLSGGLVKYGQKYEEKYLYPSKEELIASL